MPSTRAAACALAALVVPLVVAPPAVAQPAAPPQVAPEPELPDPGTDPWERVPRERLAEECGLDPVLMERADQLLNPRPYVVVRYGKLCWEARGTEEQYHVASITKTMGALLVGLAVTRSSLSDTDPITKWVPEEELLPLINREAKVAHLLSMTSTRPDLSYGRKGPWAYDVLGNREIDSLIPAMQNAIEQEPDAFPGVTNVVELAQRELFDKLGMRDSNWAGETIGFSMNSTVRDMARMGMLLLRRGAYNGERLIDAEYVHRMTHPAFEDTNTGYGYLTYNNADANWYYSTGTNDLVCSPVSFWRNYPHRPFFEAPNDNGGAATRERTYDVGLNWAAGAGGQRIVVHRGLDLVMSIRDEATNEGHKSVWNAIRPALLAHDETFAGDELGFCETYRNNAYAPDLSPDLTVAPPTVEVTGAGVTFSVVVGNPGEQHAADVPVRLYVDGERLADTVVEEIPLRSSTTVAFPLADVGAGEHTVTVQVDPDGAIAEVGDAPNEAAMTLTIPDGAGSVERYAGAGRVETAAAVSGRGLERAERVVIARADDPADALAGASLAAHLEAPLLLSSGESLSPATAREIQRLGATEAVLLGGTAALSERLAEQLFEVPLELATVRRVSGENRYATAAAIAGELPDADEVFVVRGDSAGFADAVAVSGLAATLKQPVLLTATDQLPPETADAVGERGSVVVVGGPAAVGEAVERQLAEGATVRRLSGADRYGTSAAVAEEAVARGASAATVWVATATDFPDALVAGPAAARDQALLVLVHGRDIERSPATQTFLRDAGVRTLRLAGGTAAISGRARDQLAALVR